MCSGRAWHTCELTERAQILAFLETDRFYGAYAIGDLEPGLFEQCTWAGATREGELRALTMYFRGLDPPALFLMGSSEGLGAILNDAMRPQRAYITCRPQHTTTVCQMYAWERPVPMWRMVLRRECFQPVKGPFVRLVPDQADQLRELYVNSAIDAFSPDQIGRGVFYGVLADGRLVAAAGTHLVSPTYRVAAVGNVFTHPGYRGRGYGTAVISGVVANLLELGIRDIVLNVGQQNAAALRIYDRLGFERYCSFFEGPAFCRA